MDIGLNEVKDILVRARAELSKVIIGQREVVDLALMTIFSGQHALVEGVPGIAKTLLVKSLGRILGCECARVQFTPDLMPSDITGMSVFNMKTGEFVMQKGPVFTTFLLADEINRAPAKAQAALLQAMQERQVTIDRVTHDLSPNFTVFATQNPVEHAGTYDLPEAQKDRFMVKIRMDYPARDDEINLASRFLDHRAPERVLESGALTSVLTFEQLRPARLALEKVALRDEVRDYAVDLVRQTRAHDSILVGAGPRGTQSLLLAARTMAALEGRDFTTPDDIRALLRPVLSHRILLRPEYEIEGLTVEEALAEVLTKVAVPR